MEVNQILKHIITQTLKQTYNKTYNNTELFIYKNTNGGFAWAR